MWSFTSSALWWHAAEEECDFIWKGVKLLLHGTLWYSNEIWNCLWQEQSHVPLFVPLGPSAHSYHFSEGGAGKEWRSITFCYSFSWLLLMCISGCVVVDKFCRSRKTPCKWPSQLATRAILGVAVTAQNGSHHETEKSLTWGVAAPAILTMPSPLALLLCIHSLPLAQSREWLNGWWWWYWWRGGCKRV